MSGLMAQLETVLWLPHDMDAATRAARIAAARAMLAHIDPAGGLEGMLACQMVAAHEAAMACLGRAASAGAPPEQTDQDLKHAERLMALYARQVEVLGRHRTRDQKFQEQKRREQEYREQEPEREEFRQLVHTFSYLSQIDPALYKKDEDIDEDSQEWDRDQQAWVWAANGRRVDGGGEGGTGHGEDDGANVNGANGHETNGHETNGHETNGHREGVPGRHPNAGRNFGGL